jgi:4-hydroxybenzoate polyprenyltransferase
MYGKRISQTVDPTVMTGWQLAIGGVVLVVLVKGLISPAVSLVYATLLGIAGFMLLWFGANPLACWLGVMGFVVYVGVYSLYMKRHSSVR